MHILTLSSFAVAQPLFDLLGRNASFFVAHRAQPAQILLLTIVVVLGPPAILIALRFAASTISSRAGDVVQVVCVALLAAVALTTPVVRAAGLSFLPALAVGIAIAVGVAIAYSRIGVVRRFFTVLSPAVVVFPLLFLLVSPVRDLLFGPAIADATPAAARDVQASKTPVVFVLFDELSLATLITPDGDIDARRFPGFARLAASSTWYREATTVGLRTDQAVPALLTGTRTSRREVPSSHAYPHNLFSLLSGTHRLDVREFVTQLCAPELCRTSQATTTQGLRALFTDTAVVYLHIVTPPDLARRALPPLGDRWAGFTRDPGRRGNTDDPGGDPVRSWLRTAIDERETQHEGVVFDDFLGGLEPSGRKPGLSYMHLQLPHPPWRYLPTGQTYPTGDDTPGYRNFRWGPDQYLATQVLQRSLLQTVFADKLVDRLLDRLDKTGLMEDALVVVTSDHGATWTAEGTRREIGPRHRAGMLGVPLFVKYPGRSKGRVDARNVETIDIVPTIADVLDIDPPWDVDGSSLLGPQRAGKRVFDGQRITPIDMTFSDVRRRAVELDALFGHEHDADDLYAFEPYTELVGRPLKDFDVARDEAPFTVAVAGGLGPYERIDTGQPVLPAYLRGIVSGDARRGIRYVVAINGVVAGAGQTYTEDDRVQIAVMLSHRRFRDGRNLLALYEVLNNDRLRPVGMDP